ncbi:MAG: terminase [Alphaproteobacteria bacterium]|nr:terminase [Alphaproteobacteria bacterium]
MTNKKIAFLTRLAVTGNVSASADYADLSRSQAYEWRKTDANFAASWDEALAIAVDQLALEARRRAVEGIEEVRYYQGEPIGSMRKYSDQLLMFLLRAYDPKTFQALRREHIDQTRSVQDIRDQLQKKMDQFTADKKL